MKNIIDIVMTIRFASSGRRSKLAMVMMSLLLCAIGSAPANAVVADGFISGITPAPQSFVQSMALLPHGVMLVGGRFTTSDNRTNLTRLYADGSTSDSFNVAEVNGNVYGIALQPASQILIVGSFSKIRSSSQPAGTGTTRNGIALLDQYGTVDPSFNPNATANGTQGNVFRVLRLASGKLLVGGHFTAIGGTSRAKIARLNSDGSVDTTFNAGTMNTNDYVWNFAETPDGKILVCGGFARMGNALHNNVARLNADGSNDPSFTANVTYSTSAYPSVNTVLPQINGSVVITGAFDRVNGSVRTNLARLGIDGSPDAYGTTSIPNAAIHWAVQQPDGAIVIGGSFTSLSGQSDYSKLARVTSTTGAIDFSFKPPTITGGDVYTLLRQADGKIVLGGSLTGIDGQAANYFARVYGTSLIPLAGVGKVSSGSGTTCMRMDDGTPRCAGVWTGDASFDVTSTNIPHDLPSEIDGLGNVADISAGGNASTCAVTSAGAAKCWGINDHGQVGDGTTTYRTRPTNVMGLGSDVQKIASSVAHSCVLSSTLGVRCWGNNSHGQLGDGTQTQRLVPVGVIGMPSGLQAISAGDSHTCVLTSAGGVKCWGLNASGQLGDGTVTDRLTPVSVAGLSSGIVAISAGGFSTCALTGGGAVKCWGSNTYGQLGDGSSVDRTTPVLLTQLDGDTRMVSVGRNHGCALGGDGQAMCWGNNDAGQLANGTEYSALWPNPVVGLGGTASTIHAGEEKTFAILDSGVTKAWGSNQVMALGVGSRGDRDVPTTVNRYAYTVYGSASTGGSISPAGDTLFDAGKPAVLVVTPDLNYRVSGVTSSCGGSLSGNVFTTAVVGINCTVSVSFVIDTYTVFPSVSGGHGSISPASAQTVGAGSTTSFLLTPEAGYRASVAGSCGGALLGNVFTTNTIAADCTVIASFSLDTFTVTPSVAGGNGTITPSMPQIVSFGATTSFTMMPAVGYHATVAGTCGGTLAGDTYSTNAITADCTVIATFVLDNFTVTPTVVGGNGSIAPSTPQTVSFGSTISFTLSPQSGYHASVAGTCGGTLTGNVFTTDAISANCTVVASFAINTFTVTPSVAGGHGTIAPPTPQTVASGSTTSFTLTPESSYVASVTGTCGGSLAGNTYTTNTITANCSVVASFLHGQATLTIDDARDYARYGKTIHYLVTLLNTGETSLSGTISNLMPPQLDVQATTWLCVAPDAGVQCTPSGYGPLADSVVVPSGRSVNWLISAPVRLDAEEPTIDNTVTFISPLLPNPISATDLDILVLFRNGVDHEYDDGADGVNPDLQ